MTTDIKLFDSQAMLLATVGWYEIVTTGSGVKVRTHVGFGIAV